MRVPGPGGEHNLHTTTARKTGGQAWDGDGGALRRANMFLFRPGIDLGDISFGEKRMTKGVLKAWVQFGFPRWYTRMGAEAALGWPSGPDLILAAEERPTHRSAAGTGGPSPRFGYATPPPPPPPPASLPSGPT